MVTKLGRVVAYSEGLLPIKYIELESNGLKRSRDKLKLL